MGIHPFPKWNRFHDQQLLHFLLLAPGEEPLYPAGMLPYEIEPEVLLDLQQNTGKSGSKPFLVLDVREPWEVQAAPFHGSLPMPMGDIPSRAHGELDPEQHIITVCHHGVRSMNVAVWLRNQGFDQAQSLAGGIDAWALRIDPSLPRY